LDNLSFSLTSGLFQKLYIPLDKEAIYYYLDYHKYEFDNSVRLSRLKTYTTRDQRLLFPGGKMDNNELRLLTGFWKILPAWFGRPYR